MKILLNLSLLGFALASPASAQSWVQHLVAGTTDTRLPSGLAISPTVIAFGQPRFDPYNTPGIDDVVRIFELQGSDFVEVSSFTSSLVPATSASFGVTLAMEGDLIAVGDPAASAVHLYRRNAGTWALDQVVQPALGGAQSVHGFGTSLDLDQGRLVVGAPSATSSAGTLEDGLVFVFEENQGTWQETQRLGATVPDIFNSIGLDLDLDGNQLIIGEPGAGPLGGLVHIFQHNGTDFVLSASLTATQANPEGGFGYSVAIEGNRAAVGAPSTQVQQQNDGQVHVFENLGGTWQETGLLQDPGDGHHIANHFGADLEFDGGDLFVTAFDSASVTRFEKGAGGWEAARRYTTSAGFSWPISLQLRVRARGDQVVLTDHQGVTLMERDGPAKLEFNCDGVALFNGTYSFPLLLETTQELSFSHSEVPFQIICASQLGPGVLMYGFAPTNIPFAAGGGNLCIAGSITRAALSSGTQPGGGYPQVSLDLHSGPVHSGPGSFGPGTTVYLQYWSRVPGGSSHLSNSLEMVFAP